MRYKMAKIKAEIKVLNDKYCDTEDDICPMCFKSYWGEWYCALFERVLKIDTDKGYCIRCDECKVAEVENEN